MSNPEMQSVHEQEASFLSNKKAQEEANMMRVSMRQNPETGLMRSEREPMRFQREPTAEDYDRALQVVESMKKVAETEPGFQEALETVSRFVNKSVLAVAIVAETIEAKLRKNDPIAERTLRDAKDQWHYFEDASYKIKAKLEELKNKSEEFSKDQTESEKSWRP